MSQNKKQVSTKKSKKMFYRKEFYIFAPSNN